MTVQVNDSRKVYPGNGVGTIFTGPRLFDEGTLSVFLVDDTTGADLPPGAYTVSNVGSAQSTVTMSVAPPSGTSLVLVREIPIEQSADFTNQQTLLRRVVEATFDLLVMMVQQVNDAVNRSLRLPLSSTGIDPVLPSPSPLSPLVWNAAGTAVENGDTTLTGDLLLRGNIFDGGYRFGADASPSRGGYFIDDTPTTKLHRFRDRVFFGDGVVYTGRRTAPLGGSWLTEFGASYFEKNCQVTILADENQTSRYGLLAAARGGGIGGVFVILNDDGAAGRAVYAEAMHKSNGNASSSVETATANYTATDDNPSAYSMNGARGLYVAAFDGAGYVVGDGNTPVTLATLPPAAAVDIAGYSTTATRWRKGIVFRNGSLYRGSGDGSAGEATAIAMAQQHAIVWDVSHNNRGAVIRSDVSAVGADVGIVFGNNLVQIMGTAAFPIIELVRDSAGAGAVNNAKFTSGRTGISPKLNAQGADTNVGLDLQTKGSGVLRFLGQAGASESLRVIFNNSYVNFLTATGGIAAAPAQLGAGGADANIDLALTPKGTGSVRFGTHAAIGAETLTGYITIRDSGGTLRKLAVVS